MEASFAATTNGSANTSAPCPMFQRGLWSVRQVRRERLQASGARRPGLEDPFEASCFTHTETGVEFMFLVGVRRTGFGISKRDPTSVVENQHVTDLGAENRLLFRRELQAGALGGAYPCLAAEYIPPSRCGRYALHHICNVFADRLHEIQPLLLDCYPSQRPAPATIYRAGRNRPTPSVLAGGADVA